VSAFQRALRRRPASRNIVERHAHTQVIPGSLAEAGRDATVFWNYVDLRFTSDRAFRIEAKLSERDLIVRFKSDKSTVAQTKISLQNPKSKIQSPNSCATCGVGECFRNLKTQQNLNFGRTAFLVDEFSPEFDLYVQRNRSEKDLLFLPLNGKRFRKANYAWTTAGFAKNKQSFLTALVRSYKSRKLAAQGASRQRNLLAMSEKLAASFAKNLTFDVLHVVVQQNLLPFLWRAGHLGGRTFDVLITTLPMQNLQERLDFAARRHPESRTLGDFRAEAWLVAAETEALQTARKIITPHVEIAQLFPEKVELLDWKMPPAKSNFVAKTESEKPTIVFPAATVGRKGAYELREAARGLNVKIVLLGAQLEGAEFWNGFDVEHRTGAQNWLEAADLIVLPAFVEHKPRRLLQAAAHRVPVIASKACGVANIAGIETVDAGDAASLRKKIAEKLFKLTAHDEPAKRESEKTIAAL
jgi:glycosyltransferase involved in cell wall biosynthesis